MTVGKPILVVEDDVRISNTLRMILATWSWQVHTALDLTTGRELLLTGQFGHMILDLMLPDGDGAMLLRDIREQRLSVKVIVTSANAIERHNELILLGASTVLTKPYALELLHEALTA